MARNRQRARERQEQRRAARLGQGADDVERRRGARAAGDDGEPGGDGVEGNGRTALDRPGDDGPAIYDAPPEDVGRSDTVLNSPPPVADLRADDDLDRQALAAGEDRATRRRRELAEGDQKHDRNRVVAFLASVVAELKRVQWPDRRAVTSLTGIVLGFVMIAGGYLGLLDVIFNRLIRAIL